MDYKEFLNKKNKEVIKSGFQIERSELNKNLFDFQKDIVSKALEMGAFASLQIAD